MQFTLSALALTMATTATARQFNSEGYPYNPLNRTFGYAKVFNRCSYPVYVWSIDKEMGCPLSAASKLETGDFYTEQMHDGFHDDDGGISLKISKSTTCAATEITQLEYKVAFQTEDDPYSSNTTYVDVSYVDCRNAHGDCPGRLDGYYMQSGNQVDKDQISNTNNEHCPVFHVNGGDDVKGVAYILDNDRQTKSCVHAAPLELYLCGSQAPGEEEAGIPEISEPKSSSKVEEAPKPTPEVEEAPKPEPTPVEEPVVVAAAAAEVTPPPKKAPVIKTEVVYVTKFVKRHGHARRHHH